MPTASSLARKTSLRKVIVRCGIAADWRCGALPMIDRGDIRSGNRPLQQHLGFTAGALVMVSSSIRLDSLIAKFKEAGGTVREIDV